MTARDPSPEEVAALTQGQGGLTDLAKKAIFASIGAAFMTEEAIRKYVADAKLPRDIGGFLTQNASKAKEELFTSLGREMARAISEGQLWRDVERFLATHRVKITLDFEPKSPPAVALETQPKASIQGE